MPNARDTELLNYIRSYDQSPPKFQFDHWGLTVFLAPELAKQFEAPADHMAFSSFFEQMLPHCRAFIAACPGTWAEDPEKVLQAFVDHFLTPSKNNPIPNFRRYGHKGRAQPYAIWFLKCFCNFLKENYKASFSITANNVIPFAPPPTPIPSSTVGENYPGVPGPTFPPLKAEDLVKAETNAPAPAPAPNYASSLNPFKDSSSFPTIEINCPHQMRQTQS